MKKKEIVEESLTKYYILNLLRSHDSSLTRCDFKVIDPIWDIVEKFEGEKIWSFLIKDDFIKKKKEGTPQEKILVFVLFCIFNSNFLEDEFIDFFFKVIDVNEIQDAKFLLDLSKCYSYLRANDMVLSNSIYYKCADKLILRKEKFEKKDNVALLVRNFPTAVHSGAHYNVLSSIVNSLTKLWSERNTFIFIVPQNSLVAKENLGKGLFYKKIKEDYPALKENISLVDPVCVSENFSQIAFEGLVLIAGGNVLEERLLHPFLSARGNLTGYIKFNVKNKILSPFVDFSISPGWCKQNEVCLATTYPINQEMLSKAISRNERAESKALLIKSVHPDVLNIVSVLSNGRLENAIKSLDAESLDKVKEIVRRKGVVWNFVGIKDESLVYKVFGKENVKCFSYISDLDEFYEKMDLMFHFPSVTGGGTGILRAAISGLPVLALSRTDACGYLGAENLCVSEAELFDFLKELVDCGEKRFFLRKKQLNFIVKKQSENSFAKAIFSFV